jgi:SIR2-like domain
MQLVKLHGSGNWVRNRYGEIEEREYNTSLDDIKSRSGSMDIQEGIIIYPLSQKQLYFTPFIQLFRILDAELMKRVFWIVIGYSFRDVIIRTMFERAMMDDNKRKLLLVHPHATEQIRPLFKKRLHNQLICLDKYFAKENYSDVNKEIADTLSNLTNA